MKPDTEIAYQKFMAYMAKGGWNSPQRLLELWGAEDTVRRFFEAGFEAGRNQGIHDCSERLKAGSWPT